MGSYGSRYLAGFSGPVRAPLPHKAVVVSVNGVTDIPYSSSIEAGDYGSYSLLFDQSGYVPDISEFSVDGEGVTLSLFESGSGMGLRADVADDVAGGSDFSIYFLDQEIINLTTIEKLAVVSVNGSTDFPLDLYVADGGSLDFTVGFSHDYTPYYTDFAVEPSAGGSWAPRPGDTWRFQPAAGSAGATVELYCIDTLIARVTVVADVVMNPNISSINADVPFTHNLSSLLGQSIADWKLDSVDMFGGSTFASRGTCGLHYNSDLMKWTGSSGSSWGSYGIEISLLNGKIIGGPSVYKVGKITINGVVHNIDEFN